MKKSLDDTTKRIYGQEIFFKFLEIPFNEIEKNGNLIKRIQMNDIAGFIAKNVFSPDEILQLKDYLNKLKENNILLEKPSGEIFPAPFAAINGTDNIDWFYSTLDLFSEHKETNPIINSLLNRIDTFFKTVAQDYQVSIPLYKVKNREVCPGTFRIYTPGKGGLQIHCGNLFHTNFVSHYSLLKNTIDMNNQLSFFMVLQHSEEGGELTIYDLMWNKVKRKETYEETDVVIDDEGNRININTVRNFSVKPQPGDIIVFSGGNIWHRVEEIKGINPRITFGGFLNFSDDNKELFYWS